MGLYEDLIESVREKALNTFVEDIRVGTTWTAVKTEKVGLSLTYTSLHDRIEDSGNLTGKPASKILDFLKGFSFLELSVGTAALNSLIEAPEHYERFNMFDFIKEECRGKKTVFIGHFHGVEKLVEIAKELKVLERNPKEGDIPDTAAEYVVPDAEVVAITGSAFANKSIEKLLQLSKGLTIVFGPSTPLSPILFEYGADIIGGAIVKDEEAIIKAVSEGGHLVDFKKHLEYVVLRK